MPTSIKNKLIHVGRINGERKSPIYLFLREDSPEIYRWYRENSENEEPTEVEASSIESALQMAHKRWRQVGFRTVICGFCYTLPERDEHGINALFHQMIAAYSTPNGVYFDADYGHLCEVKFASLEALKLWKRLEQKGRI